MGRSRAKRRSGDSVQKKVRARHRIERKEQKRSGKPAGDPVKVSETQRILRRLKQDPKKQVVQLRPIGGGWFPKITVEVLAKLKKLESTSLGQYSYVVMRDTSNQNRVCFEVGYCLDLSSKKGKHIGDFEIDLKMKTVRRISLRGKN